MNIYYIKTQTQEPEKEPEKKTQKDAPKTAKTISEKEKQAEVKLAGLKNLLRSFISMSYWYSALIHVVQRNICILVGTRILLLLS